MMDLRVLVNQMQTDAFAWHTLDFKTSRRSIQLVKEAKEAAAQARRPEGAPSAAAAAAAVAPAAEDEPPPLEADTSVSHGGRPEAEVD